MSGLYVPFQEWVEYLDIHEGDILLVSSDIQRAALAAFRNKENFSPDLLIESLQKKLTSEGTLMFPTFNWDFCKGLRFDYRGTPCMTGALGRAALGRNDFRRSLHPIYSFAVWGRDRDCVCEMRNIGSFGEDSPFAYLHEKGKSLMIDVSMRNSFTFAHYVEERLAVPYRYMKTFTALYRGPDGCEGSRSYSMYVRYLEKNVVTLIYPIGEDMVKTGKLKRKTINDIPFSTLIFADFYEAAEKDILENHARKLCRYDGQPGLS
jgi:aminoglycoside 3-N-acetyltransferase